MAQKRYIGNRRSKVGHDRSNLKERCNTDAIGERAEYDEVEWVLMLATGWRTCRWCGGPRDYR